MTNTSKIITFFLLFFLFHISIFGQNVASDDVTKTKAVKEDKNAIMVFAGFPGVGGFYGRKLNNHFTMRAGGSFSKVDDVLENFEFEGYNFDAQVKLDYQAAHLHLEYLPFKKSSFKLVGGISYISNFNAFVNIQPRDIQYGEILLSDEAIGMIELDAKWSGFSPYAALGFGRTVPKHRIGFGFEIGGNFLSNPSYNLKSSGVFEPTAEIDKESNTIGSFLDKITVLPTIQFHLNFKF